MTLGLAGDSLRRACQALVLADKGVQPPAPVIRCEDHLVELAAVGYDAGLADRAAADERAGGDPAARARG